MALKEEECHRKTEEGEIGRNREVRERGRENGREERKRERGPVFQIPIVSRLRFPWCPP